MAELSETTRVRLQAGAAIAAVIFCVYAGKYWGNWESDSVHVKQAVEAHELRLTSLESRMAGIDNLLVEIKSKQEVVNQSAAAAARFSSYMVDGLASLRSDLATSRGIPAPPKKEE